MTELVWDGKYRDGKRVLPLRNALPIQTVETVDRIAHDRSGTLDLFAAGSASGPGSHGASWRNRLIWGDTKYVLPSLLPEFAGKVDLVYIDPPFNTGGDFTLTTAIPDFDTPLEKRSRGIEQMAYRDTWVRGLDSYLQWMSETLALLHDLLAEHGSLFLHLDANLVHYAKCIADEVFPGGFRSEIIWHHNVIGTGTRAFPKSHETILWFSKSEGWYIDPSSEHVRVPYSDRVTKTLKQDDKGFYYVRGNRDSSGKVTGQWFRTYVDLDELEKGKLAADVWDDIKSYRAQGEQSTGYPTQKPEKLIKRIVGAFCPPDGLVLDGFCGAGTTAAVAERLGRRWITCDLGRHSIHTTRKRLLGIPDVKPFLVQNLGPHERQAWVAAEFGAAGDRAASEIAYHRFILELYRAQPISGHARIHGLKTGRFVHIGSVELPVTLAEVEAIVRDVSSAAGKTGGGSGPVAAVDILGWEFSIDLGDAARQIAVDARVDVRFKYIPRDALDGRAIEQRGVQAKDFVEPRGLSTKSAVSGHVACVEIADFSMPTEDLSEDARAAVAHFSQWIDYVAIDWDFKAPVFHEQWRSHRTRDTPKLELVARHEYEAAGTYSVAIKVVDLFARDTMRVISLDVRGAIGSP